MNTTTLNMTTLDGGVIIKKGTAPAPPSGGESGGNTSNWRYFDYSAVTAAEAKSVLMGLSHLIATPIGGQMCILPSTIGSSSAMTKGAICWDVPVVGPFNEEEEMRQMPYGEFVEFMTTANGIDFASIPEITKEEFYNLE